MSVVAKMRDVSEGGAVPSRPMAAGEPSSFAGEKAPLVGADAVAAAVEAALKGRGGGNGGGPEGPGGKEGFSSREIFEWLMGARVGEDESLMSDKVEALELFRQGLPTHVEALKSLSGFLDFDGIRPDGWKEVLDKLPAELFISSLDTGAVRERVATLVSMALQRGDLTILHSIYGDFPRGIHHIKMFEALGVGESILPADVLYIDLMAIMLSHEGILPILKSERDLEGRPDSVALLHREFHALWVVSTALYTALADEVGPGAEGEILKHGEKKMRPSPYNLLFQGRSRDDVRIFLRNMLALILPDKDRFEELAKLDGDSVIWAPIVQEENVSLALMILAKKHGLMDEFAGFFGQITLYRRAQSHLFLFDPTLTNAPKRHYEGAIPNVVMERVKGLGRKVNIAGLGVGDAMMESMLVQSGMIDQITKMVDVVGGDRDEQRGNDFPIYCVALHDKNGKLREDLEDRVIEALLPADGLKPDIVFAMRVIHEFSHPGRALYKLMKRIDEVCPGATLVFLEPTWAAGMDPSSPNLADFDMGALDPEKILTVEDLDKALYLFKMMMGAKVQFVACKMGLYAGGGDSMACLLGVVQSRKEGDPLMMEVEQVDDRAEIGSLEEIFELWPFSEIEPANRKRFLSGLLPAFFDPVQNQEVTFRLRDFGAGFSAPRKGSIVQDLLRVLMLCKKLPRSDSRSTRQHDGEAPLWIDFPPGEQKREEILPGWKSIATAERELTNSARPFKGLIQALRVVDYDTARDTDGLLVRNRRAGRIVALLSKIKEICGQEIADILISALRTTPSWDSGHWDGYLIDL